MIILITGASHTGKTVLAQKLLEKYRFPYFSIDHLKMGLIRSGNTHLKPEDDDALTEYLWPVVREIIKTAVENRQNLIIEGCYIPPDWRKSFDERYLPSVRFICLAMTEDYIEGHFDDILVHESDMEFRLTRGDCSIEDLKKCNRWFIEAFSAAGEKVFLIENDYSTVLQELTDWQIGICGGNKVNDCHEDFWNALDELMNTSEIVIDRPKGSAHPRFPDFIYQVDYGYLKNTVSADGAEIDVWVGSGDKKIDAVMCIVDLMKRDSEIKILIGCTEEEKTEVYRTHNEKPFMKGILIRR